jgi:hypothetical protein
MIHCAGSRLQMSQLLGPHNVQVTLHVDQKRGIHLATVANIAAAHNIKHSSFFQIKEHWFCSENIEVSFHSVMSYRTTRLQNSRHTSMNSHKRTPVLFPQRFPQVTLNLVLISLRDHSRKSDLSLTSRIIKIRQASKCGQKKVPCPPKVEFNNKQYCVGSEVLSAETMKTFWGLIENCWCFEGTCCPYLPGRRVSN